MVILNEIDRLKEIMTEEHLSQEEIAKEIGITQGAVSLLFRNKRFPRGKTYLQIISYIKRYKEAQNKKNINLL